MTATTKRKTAVIPKNGDLLDQTVVAHLATARPDGSLQSNPVWFEWDGAEIKISQTRDRQKLRNIEHDPHVALSVTDPEDPYRYVEIRGVVDRVDDDTDRSFVDGLAQRYMGKPRYDMDPPDAERVIVHIRPTDSSAMAA